MSFDYDKFKAQEENGSYWASYSDLFMVLSMVFLLLYVFSSLRSGTHSIQQQQEYNRMAKENKDLKEQIKVYSTLKDDYLQTGASQQEQKLYEELMGKLDLLQEDAKDEKIKLRQAAADNEKKEKALNKYQQMIRNIINSNMISQARIKTRESKISKRDEIIKTKKTEINQLEKTVAEKEKRISKSEKEIEKINNNLEMNIAKLKKSYERNKITKKKMQARIAAEKKRSDRKLQKLQEKTKQFQEELTEVASQLGQAESQLAQAQNSIQEKSQELERAKSQMNQYRQRVSSIEQDFEDKMSQQRNDFEAQLAKQKLSSYEKLKKQVAFQKKLKAQKAEMQAQVAQIQAEASEAKKRLGRAEAQKAKFARSVAQLKDVQSKLKKDLKETKKVAEARNRLIRRIKNNLKKAGVKASVDPRSGDVVISFGDEYFNTGKAKLKPGMKLTLQKFMPVYAQSLFEDKETAEKIESVEIIGFASPTYKGKYVDPSSLSPKDKKAAEFNLNLSYRRAKSIFDYIFDTSKMKYVHQKTMLPKVSVSGKSFFAEGSQRDIASGISTRDYCAKYDCKKAQRVIIRFDMTN